MIIMSMSGAVFSGIAQEAYSQLHFLKGCASYREKFVHSIIHAVADFNNMMDAYKPEISDRRVIERLKANVNRRFSALGVMTSHETQQVDSIAVVMPDSELSLIARDWLIAHASLIMEFRIMVDNNLIKPDYPYQLLHPADLWEEMQFYDFRINDRIVDVGAGTGFLSFLLRYGDFPVTLWLTEIDASMRTWMEEKRGALDTVAQSMPMYIVEAKSNTIGVAPGSADKIIMRLTFHHLSQPLAILQDVHRVLAEDGFFFLTEEPKSGSAKEPQCSKVMRTAKLEKWIEKGGFEIVAQRHGANIVQYKCRSLKE